MKASHIPIVFNLSVDVMGVIESTLPNRVEYHLNKWENLVKTYLTESHSISNNSQ